MESSSRSEAQRWLTIAEKLLTAHDLQGTRTFAIRARESDPRLEAADQILAVVDTLLAGESRINSHQHDCYAILQLARLTQNMEVIATQYRKLALLLNPDKNKLAFAEQAFKLVSDAWTVLSNPSKKALYDNELRLSQLRQLGQLGEQQQHHNYNQTPPVVRRSPRTSKEGGGAPVAEGRPSLDNATESTPPTRPARPARPSRPTESEQPSFWTACPYCYILYEYPSVYQECTLRCQSCQRAFHAVMIPSPPVTGKDSYFCCWGFFPLGFSGNAKDIAGFSSGWSPISSMFTCPVQGDGRPNQVSGQNRNFGKPKNVNNASKKAAPRVYYDDDDVYIEVTDPSDNDSDSDDEWGSGRRKKKAKNFKGKGSVAKNVKKPQVERITRGSKNVDGQVNVGSGNENLDGGSMMQEGVVGPASSSKVAVNSAKKQMGRGAKEVGKLDLNVEFSNEVEEAALGMGEGNGTGHGEEDNMEGIAFFEGLDEFLSSLPILSVVGDDKVKAT